LLSAAFRFRISDGANRSPQPQQNSSWEDHCEGAHAVPIQRLRCEPLPVRSCFLAKDRVASVTPSELAPSSPGCTTARRAPSAMPGWFRGQIAGTQLVTHLADDNLPNRGCSLTDAEIYICVDLFDVVQNCFFIEVQTNSFLLFD
jgi:hypothetical protein